MRCTKTQKLLENRIFVKINPKNRRIKSCGILAQKIHKDLEPADKIRKITVIGGARIGAQMGGGGQILRAVWQPPPHELPLPKKFEFTRSIHKRSSRAGSSMNLFSICYSLESLQKHFQQQLRLDGWMWAKGYADRIAGKTKPLPAVLRSFTGGL